MQADRVIAEDWEVHGLRLATSQDVQQALRASRRLCLEAGFRPDRAMLVVTAVSELARNAICHGGGGWFSGRRLFEPRPGVEMEVADQGPGIPDVEAAFSEHFSTRGTLGIGLPAVRRIMDEVDLDTAPGRGVRIRVRKWLR